jgi:hypothetical protein
MKLPENFSFNQQNLEDFVKCRRLFYLRHILKQEWPALETEPVLEHEQLMRLGEQFHQLVYQQGVGIPADVLASSVDDAILGTWQMQYDKLEIAAFQGTKRYETLMTVPFDKYRLVAKYDLLIFTPENHALIYDWKTSQREPQRKWLQNRMQTCVYPMVLALKKGNPVIQPQDITMTYWYPAFPESTIQFEYSQEQFESDQAKVLGLIRDIESLDPGQFNKTEQTKRCEFCNYRSLCERGEKAGDFRTQESVDDEASSPFDIDFDALPAQD